MTRDKLEQSAQMMWEATYARDPEWALDILRALNHDENNDVVAWTRLTARELRAVRCSCYLTLEYFN